MRKLVNFEEIQFILNNHTVGGVEGGTSELRFIDSSSYLSPFPFQSEHFSFLGTNVAVTEMRNRSMFYTSLGRLFLVDFNEDEERFDNFMLPITSEKRRGRDSKERDY